MAKIKEGSNSFLLQTLTAVLASEGALRPDKVDAVRTKFLERLMSEPMGKQYPAETNRHAWTILSRLFPVTEQAPVLDLHKEVPIEALKLPEAVRSKTEEALRNFLQGKEEKTPPSNPGVNLALDPADMDLLLEDVNDAAPAALKDGLQVALEETADRFAKGLKHPFIDTLRHDGKYYTVVGTAVIHSAKRAGCTRNSNCTVNNLRRIKDADERILVHRDGRPMVVSRELENGGGVCFVWLLHQKPGLGIRFWLNERDNGTSKDNPRGTFRVTLTEDGWKKAG
jgi:hypothetical protein